MARLHRFFGEFSLIKGKEISLTDPGFLHQIKDVFRLKLGDIVVLCDMKGLEAKARLAFLSKAEARVRIEEVNEIKAEPHRKVTLYAAVSKRENFEWTVQKATEVGVFKIVPILTERTVKVGLNTKRLEKIAKEAAEQSGRGLIPKIETPTPFLDAVKKRDGGMSIFFDTLYGGKRIQAYKSIPQSCSVWIGPEGGWSEPERKAISSDRFEIASLGPLTLRSETAAVISSYIVCNFPQK